MQRIERHGRVFEISVRDNEVVAYDGGVIEPVAVLSAPSMAKLEEVIDRNELLTKKFGAFYAKHVCCENATILDCVCSASWSCPEHAPEGRHVGTHD